MNMKYDNKINNSMAKWNMINMNINKMIHMKYVCIMIIIIRITIIILILIIILIVMSDNVEWWW